MLDTIIILVASLLILSKSAQLVIDNSLTLARFFHVSELAIGFILLSVATSLPELIVTLIASLENQSGISVGTLIGSNIADIGLVLGISFFLSNMPTTRRESDSINKIILLTSFLPLLLFFPIGRFTGVLLLLVFMVYVYFILKDGLKIESSERVGGRRAVISSFKFMAGILLLVGSSRYTVDSAVELANMLHISKIFIASTTIAVGTSIPELAVNITAIRRRNYSLALGNVVGSCITNLTLILGIAVLMSPLSVSMNALINLVIFQGLLNAALIFLFHYRKKVGRAEGILLMGIYLIFIITSVLIES